MNTCSHNKAKPIDKQSQNKNDLQIIRFMFNSETMQRQREIVRLMFANMNKESQIIKTLFSRR